MLSKRNNTLGRQLVLAVAAVVAVAAALLTPGPAKAAFTIGGSPGGAVTNSENGTIWYVAPSSPQILGWAADPDAGPGPISVTADVTWYRTACRWTCFSMSVGQMSLSQTASLYETATDGTVYGPNHGFASSLPSFFGTYDSERVCVTAINVGIGSNTSLGCFDVKGIVIN